MRGRGPVEDPSSTWGSGEDRQPRRAAAGPAAADGRPDRGNSASTSTHDRWLRQVRAGALWPAGTRSTFDAYYDTVVTTTARRDRLDAEIAAMAAASEFTPVARRPGCLRGISTLTGFALAVEIGDWTRFSGSSIGAFVGLTHSEHSTGSSRSQGSITKTGNSHARRLLVEAAWHHQRAYRPGKTMQDRWALAPIAAQVRGDAGNRRLHRQWLRFTARKKRPTIAVVTVARELAGWLMVTAWLQPAPGETRARLWAIGTAGPSSR